MKKITQGEWKVFSIEQLGIKLKSVFGIKSKTLDSICIVNYHKNQDGKEAKANAEAICKAVNNTYGKGIDPEKIELIMNIFGDIKQMCSHKQSVKWDILESMANTALKEIKLEDK